MLKYNLLLHGIMVTIVSFGVSTNYSMDTNTLSVLGKKNSMNLYSLVKEQQKLGAPHVIAPQQSLVNIKQEQMKNNRLMIAFNTIAHCSSNIAVAYTVAIQYMFTNMIGKHESMKKLPAKELNKMSIEKKRLTLSLGQLKSDGTFVATQDECDNIAGMLPIVKDAFKDITVKVPASSTDITVRVAKNVGFSVLPGVIAGALINGRIGAIENNRTAQELHEQNKAIIYKDVYKQAFEKSYVENFERQIDEEITKDACLTGVLAEFIVGTTNELNVDDIGLAYGRKFRQQAMEGNLNPWSAFHQASIEECQKRLNPAIRERTIIIASGAAKTVADMVVQNLAKPVTELLSNSGMQSGASLGLGLSTLSGLTTSLFKGDFTRPKVCKKVGDL